MIDSIINCKNLKEADAVIFGAGYDETSSFGMGAENGPKEIIKCLDRQIEFFEKYTQTEPAYLFKIGYKNFGELNGLSPEKVVDKIIKEYEKYVATDKFGVVIGGNHSVSIAPIYFFSKRYFPKDITVLQIDAHLDLRNNDSDYNDKSPSKYAHSCVMRRACEMGFKTIQVGVRAYSKDEYDYAKENNLTIFEWGKGEIPSAKTIVKSIKTDKVYLSIDVDGLDPSVMPATGTPVSGGLEWNYFLELIRELFKSKNVIGADIVEVAPRKGDNLTQYNAAQLCYNIISYKLLKLHKKLDFKK